MTEAIERKEKKAKASSAYIAAQAAVSVEGELKTISSKSTVTAEPRGQTGSVNKIPGAPNDSASPLAILTCRVLEAVRPHGFARRDDGQNYTLNVVFEVEGEEGRAQTRYNAPGSSLMWLDPVRMTRFVLDRNAHSMSVYDDPDKIS